MKIKTLCMILLAALTLSAGAQNTAVKMTDSNTALHALPPDYPVPYGAPKTEDVKAVLDRVYTFLDASTPVKMIDRQSKAAITDLSKLNQNSIFDPGVFRLISYEWGVAYGAMLLASEATGDPKYKDYTVKRMNFIGDVASVYRSGNNGSGPVRSVLEPRALDDAGSMCAAMIKTMNAGGSSKLHPCIDNYINYVFSKQQRLSDGTLARNRPLANALWLDDLYMSVPALAQMGKLSGDSKYFDDACRQENHAECFYFHGQWLLGM